MNRNRYWKITRSGLYGTAKVLFEFIVVIMISSVFLLASYWFFWLMIIAGFLILLLVWHAKNFAYLCPGCGEVFKVSTLKGFISPNGVNKKYLRCPRCGKKAWADMLRIKEKIVLKK